jgi:ribonuclease HI
MIKAIYTDGSTSWKNPSPYGVAWSFVAVDENDREVHREVGIVKTDDCKGFKASNNLVEMLAAIKGLEFAYARSDRSSVIRLYSDSELTINRLFNHYSVKLLPKNVVERGNAVLVNFKLERVNITPVLLAGHPTKKDLSQGFKVKKGKQYPVSKWNVLCDKLASEAAQTLIPISVLSKSGTTSA